MADATQTQIRRDTAANLDGATPALAELAYDQTNKRLRLGDGSTQGAITVPNYRDVQGQTFGYAVAGGSTNAITLALNPALVAYTEGVSIEFRATSNNTGATTVNVNGLGVRNIYRKENDGITAMGGGELLAGGVYRITYDGTQFQLISSAVPDAGALLLLAQKNVDSGGVLEFRGVMSTIYRGYKIIFDGFSRGNGAPEVRMRYSTDNGANFLTSNYTNSGVTQSSYIVLNGGQLTGNVNISGVVELTATDECANLAVIDSVTRGSSAALSNLFSNRGLRVTGTSVVNAIQIYTNTTIGSGAYTGNAAIYGYVR